jgi:hypothetical protein
MMQEEGGVFLRDSDAEVERLDRLEELNIVVPVVGGLALNGPSSENRRRGGTNSKKKNNNNNNNKQGATKCVRFASVVQAGRRPKQPRNGSISSQSREATQTSDPIQNSGDNLVCEEGIGEHEVSDMNSINHESLVDGVLRSDHQLDSVNFCIEAERLFNIWMNLGISSNEDRIAMIELIDSEGGERRVEIEVGDVMIDQ